MKLRREITQEINPKVKMNAHFYLKRVVLGSKVDKPSKTLTKTLTILKCIELNIKNFKALIINDLII